MGDGALSPGRAIRAARPDDAGAMLAIYAPYVRDSSVSFEEDVPSEGEFLERVLKVQAYAPWLVCELEGRVAGYAYASRHRERAAYRWSVETSVYVAAWAHRRGVARELYVELFALLKRQGYCNAYAGITLPNAASVGFHEALGFRKVGVYHAIGFKFGAWHDVGWWELAIQDHHPVPPPSLSSAWRSITSGR